MRRMQPNPLDAPAPPAGATEMSDDELPRVVQ